MEPIQVVRNWSSTENPVGPLPMVVKMPPVAGLTSSARVRRPSLPSRWRYTALSRFWFRVPFKLFSHKVLRWLGPWLGLGALVFSSAAVFMDSYVGGVLFGLQLFFYLAALLGWAMRDTHLPFPFKAAYYLTLSNLAELWGYVVLITQLKEPAWEKLR